MYSVHHKICQQIWQICCHICKAKHVDSNVWYSVSGDRPNDDAGGLFAVVHDINEELGRLINGSLVYDYCVIQIASYILRSPTID